MNQIFKLHTTTTLTNNPFKQYQKLEHHYCPLQTTNQMPQLQHWILHTHSLSKANMNTSVPPELIDIRYTYGTPSLPK